MICSIENSRLTDEPTCRTCGRRGRELRSCPRVAPAPEPLPPIRWFAVEIVLLTLAVATLSAYAATLWSGSP